MKYEIEYKKGTVKFSKLNLLLEDTEEMDLIEAWEERLTKLDCSYAVVFKEKDKGKVVYNIFADLYKKGSPFKCV